MSLCALHFPSYNFFPCYLKASKLDLTQHTKQFSGVNILRCRINNVLPDETKPETFIAKEERRSANYKPNIWSYDYIESLTSEYADAAYQRRIEKLKMEFTHIFNQARGMTKLQLIESMNNLCLSSLFEKEIRGTLDILQYDIGNSKGTLHVLQSDGIKDLKDDLEAIALCFRLLRQYGYNVSQDMFINFIDKTGAFKERLRTNIRGVLQLYEASHLAIQEENIMDKAKDFSEKCLKDLDSNIDVNILKRVTKALEYPLHWVVQWYWVRWQIDAYEHQIGRNPILVELAKLNFNMIQAFHQRELQELSVWWKNLKLMQDISFSRDRLIESFLCAIGVASSHITHVYELECFTRAVDRWDSKEIEHLPELMKLCFSTLQDTTNEIAQAIHKERCWDGVLPSMRKAWTDLLKAFLLEAQWFNEGYMPSLEEYLKCAWISSSCPLLSLITHLLGIDEPDEEFMDKWVQRKNLIYYSSLIFRLWNDLDTLEVELERGDTPSSILCYMREANVSKDIVEEQVRGLIINAWKNINEDLIKRFSKNQVSANLIINIARFTNFLYHNGDGFSVQDREIKKLIKDLLIEPVTI